MLINETIGRAKLSEQSLCWLHYRQLELGIFKEKYTL